MTLSVDTSAAADIAARIRQRVPGWTETQPAPRRWRWTSPAEEDGYFGEDPPAEWVTYVDLDGSDREFLRLVPEQEGQHHGPTVLARSSGATLRLDLPNMMDRLDREQVLDVLVAFGALPDEKGMRR